jgi:glycosyltransferase involved in cell wall biosynthesis
VTEAEAESAAAAQRAEYGVPPGAHVLLCLSRISPEKGQDTLLEALAEWERRSDYPSRPLWLFLCGEAAFMQGRSFEARLRSLAARLTRTRVVWPGYVGGARKQGFFRLADLYIFPSRHESYGLTLMEALAAGLPAVALSHQGSRDILRPEFGALVDGSSPVAAREGLRAAITRLLALEGSDRVAMRSAAAGYAAAHPFSASAAALARVLVA